MTGTADKRALRRVRQAADDLWEETKAGAIDFTRIIAADPSAQDQFDVEVIFEDAVLAELREMVRKAGFPKWPERCPEAKRVEIAAAFAGALPSFENAKDKKGGMAAVLVAMARAEYRLAQHLERGDLGSAWREGVHMGRLTEWWRWRSGGHDAQAVHSQQATRGFRKGDPNAGRPMEAARWKAEAKRIAAEKRRARPDLSPARIAELVETELRALDAHRIAALAADLRADNPRLDEAEAEDMARDQLMHGKELLHRAWRTIRREIRK